MSFPALNDFEADPGVTFARWRVYTHLRRNVLEMDEPKPVKVWGLTISLHMRKRAIIDALNWLTANGYIREHEREHAKATRIFTLAYARKFPNGTNQAAA